jgi:hypothetical protein
MSGAPLTPYGAPVGLHTGKIRSDPRKQGIPYTERLPTDPVLEREVMPAVKRFINPVIRFADGTLVQDSADTAHTPQPKTRFRKFTEKPLFCLNAAPPQSRAARQDGPSSCRTSA